MEIAITKQIGGTTMTTKFKSNGMQWATFYYVGTERTDHTPMYRQIGYWTPEERIEKEDLEILHDSESCVAVLTPQQDIIQFENN